MRRSKTDTEKNTAEIISVALDIFSKKGYQATNLQDIADALGITRMPLYYHFKNKLQLYEQVIEAYLREKERNFSDIYCGDQDIFKKTESHMLRCTEYGVMETVLFMGVEDNPEMEYVSKIRRKTTEFIFKSKKQAVAEATRKGELKKGVDPAEFIGHAYVIYFGMMNMTSSAHMPYEFQGKDLRLKLIDTTIQGMKQKYAPKAKDKAGEEPVARAAKTPRARAGKEAVPEAVVVNL